MFNEFFIFSKVNYAITNNAKSITLGAVTYAKDATLLDRSDAAYDYSNVSTIDTKGFSVDMSDAVKEAKVSDSMILLKGNSTLADIATEATRNKSYSYTPAAGLTVNTDTTGLCVLNLRCC